MGEWLGGGTWLGGGMGGGGEEAKRSWEGEGRYHNLRDRLRAGGGECR